MGAFFDDGKDRRTAIARPRSSQSSRHRLPQWGRDVTRSMRLAVGVLGVIGAVGDEALLASSSTFMYVLQDFARHDTHFCIVSKRARLHIQHTCVLLIYS